MASATASSPKFARDNPPRRLKLRSLTWKLVLSFWLVSLVGITVGTLFAAWVSLREFRRLTEVQNQDLLAAQLTTYYQLNRSWQGIESASFRQKELGWLNSIRGFILADPQGRVILPSAESAAGRRLTPEQFEQGRAIQVGGEVVGVLWFTPEPPGRRPPPPLGGVLMRVVRDLTVGGLAATALSLLLGFLLARNLTQPLQALAAATQAVALGDFERNVPVRSQDEIGLLARSFNEMIAQLKRSRDLRRQMTADVAHELRTPLSLILGHAEAMSEGVLPPTPEALEVIHDEARHLTRLVEDLRTLSLSETGELSLMMRPLSPNDLLAEVRDSYASLASRQGLSFEVQAAEDLPELHGDPDRLTQVLHNLLNNALRFTPTGGRVTLSARRSAGGVELRIQDNGPGISAEDLPNVFERFYRGDKARHRQDGGAGLGLAIAKSLIELHQGKIWVESQPGEGTTFFIWLPAAG